MVARKRYSIYPSPDLDRVLEARLVDTEATNDDRAEPLRGRSATITAMVCRYAQIVADHTPVFSPTEWTLIVDSLNGYWVNDNPQLAANGIALNVADNDRLNGAGHRFNVDGQALAQRIAALTTAEQIAILDVSERFWAGSAQPSESYSALFKRLAGHISLDTDRPRRSDLILTVQRASELAYDQDCQQIIGRIDGSWHIADAEDIGRINQMSEPRFTVQSDGLDPVNIANATEGVDDVDIDQDWHNETTIYRIGDDTISVSGPIVAINQHA